LGGQGGQLVLASVEVGSVQTQLVSATLQLGDQRLDTLKLVVELVGALVQASTAIV
jgi:hypothetical protein